MTFIFGWHTSLIAAIAEQTNLLALKATRHRGGTGQRFAVVAYELGAQAAKATDDVGTILANRAKLHDRKDLLRFDKPTLSH